MRKILGPRGQVVAVEMTAAEWAKTHRDFKGRLEDGTRTVLTCDTAVAGGGSILAPVTIVKDSPQHNPRAARRRHQPGTRYRRAYDFFRQHAGGIVGESAKSAKALAEAESWARGRGVEFHWQDDPDADASFVETWPAKDQKRWNAEEHTVEGLVAIDPSTRAETSLWGIFDADKTYRRVLEAELALQLMPERRRVRPRAPAKRNPRGKTDGVTRDGIMWHIGGETIALSDGGNRKRYSGYTLAEALAEFRAEFPQENPRRKSRAETSVAYQKALGGRIRKVAASLGEHGRIIADVRRGGRRAPGQRVPGRRRSGGWPHRRKSSGVIQRGPGGGVSAGASSALHAVPGAPSRPGSHVQTRPSLRRTPALILAPAH